MGIFYLYTDLSTISTNEKKKITNEKTIKSERAFCEVVIKIKKARNLSQKKEDLNCAKTTVFLKQNDRIVAK